jgi:hypothetical protein
MGGAVVVVVDVDVATLGGGVLAADDLAGRVVAMRVTVSASAGPLVVPGSTEPGATGASAEPPLPPLPAVGRVDVVVPGPMAAVVLGATGDDVVDTAGPVVEVAGATVVVVVDVVVVEVVVVDVVVGGE